MKVVERTWKGYGIRTLFLLPFALASGFCFKPAIQLAGSYVVPMEIPKPVKAVLIAGSGFGTVFVIMSIGQRFAPRPEDPPTLWEEARSLAQQFTKPDREPQTAQQEYSNEPTTATASSNRNQGAEGGIRESGASSDSSREPDTVG